MVPRVDKRAEHPKGIQDERYRQLLGELVATRKSLGLTQVDLAARLGRKQHFVSRFETGERRLDFIELIDVSRALGLAPEDLVKDVPSATIREG